MSADTKKKKYDRHINKQRRALTRAVYAALVLAASVNDAGALKALAEGAATLRVNGFLEGAERPRVQTAGRAGN